MNLIELANPLIEQLRAEQLKLQTAIQKKQIMKNIHIIPTDKPSRLLKTIPKGNLLLHKENIVGSHWENQNIYITNSEEIKEGDWILPPSNIPVKYDGQKYKGDEPLKCWKKIILTTDQDLIKDGVQAIDDEFLEWFVMNPSCERVEIYSLGIKNGETGESCHYKYEIIIPQEEPKQETLEEANWKVLGTQDDTFYKGAKWQADRMYTEEEVLAMLLIKHDGLSPEYVLQQFKKK